MSPRRRGRRRTVRPDIVKLLELVPDDDWIAPEDLTAAVIDTCPTICIDKAGHPEGLRALRRAGAVKTNPQAGGLIRRTPKGAGILAAATQDEDPAA